MKKVSTYSLILSIILIFISCKEREKGFEVNANINGFPENSKVLISDVSSKKILDSTKLINGKFTLRGFLDNEPTNISIEMIAENDERNFISIFMGNEKISITGDNKNLDIKGSTHNDLKVALDKKVNPLYDKQDEKLQKMFAMRNEGEWNDSLQSAYWSKNGIIAEIDNEIFKEKKQFIADHINSDYALDQLAGNKTNFSKEFIKEQLQKVNEDYRTSRYVKALKTHLENEPLKAGESFYNFKAENQNGESVDFASFFNKEKEYILLEFYSPHCGWCKKALPEIKKLKASEDEKLQIVTYNVDKNKEDWLKTTKSNNITWTTIWNKNGRYSDAFTKYRVVGTPTYYLFNKEGKVVNTWTGFDENTISSIKAIIQ